MSASSDLSDHISYGLLAIRPGNPGEGTAVIFDVFENLDLATYDHYSAAYAHVSDAHDGDLSIYSMASLDQLNNFAGQIEAFSTTLSTGGITASRSSWHTTLSGAVLTFCASTHMYQEQTEGAVAKHFGLDSAERREIHARFRQAYDSSFGYRVIYRLRNVLVHHSMKSVGFGLAVQLEPDGQGLERPVAKLELPLVRSIFLGARKGVSATIREELSRLEADPDIRTLARAAVDAIIDLRQDSMSLIHPNLGADCSTVNELSARFPPWSEADRALVTVTFVDGVPQFPQIPLRRDVFEYAATRADLGK